MLAYSCAGGDHKKYASAMAHMQVGNYNIAKKELESIPGSDLEYIVKAMEKNNLFPESAQMYGAFHHPQEDMTVRKLSLGSAAVTSLEHLKASAGTDFLAVGTEAGQVYFFNESGSVRMSVEGEEGDMYATKDRDYAVARAKKGGIYKIGVEAVVEKEVKKYTIISTTIFKSPAPIGEIRPYDITGDGIPEYFFTLSSGEALGVTLAGETVFHSEAKADQEMQEMEWQIPPAVASFCENDHQYVITHLDKNIVIYRASGEKHWTISLEEKLKKEILVGNIDGSKCRNILAGTESYVYKLNLACPPRTEPENCSWTTSKSSIEYIAISNWKLRDIDADGFEDIVYGNENTLGILFGYQTALLNPKWEGLKWKYEKWNPLKDYWNDETQLSVVAKSIDEIESGKKIKLTSKEIMPLLDFEYADSTVS